jgi:hypothetical protein
MATDASAPGPSAGPPASRRVLSALLLLGRKGAPTWQVVRRPLTVEGKTYQVGDRLDVDTVNSWRNGHRLVDLGWLAPASEPPPTTERAQRSAAGQKSREAARRVHPAGRAWKSSSLAECEWARF